MTRWVNIPKSVIMTPYEQQLMDFFKRFDADGDGRLDKQELTNAFKSLGSRCPAWRVNRGFHHADINGDGSISAEELEELVKYVSKLGYKIPNR